MTIKYRDIKPWGRSFDEYIRMFSLTPTYLKRKIIDCGDGPASFNAELTEQGGNIHLLILFTISVLIRSDSGSVKHMMK